MILGRRAALGVVAGLAATPVAAFAPRQRSCGRTTTVWATANAPLEYPIADRTVRLAVRATGDAPRLRARISNAFGTAPLRIGSLHVGARASGPAIRPGSNRRATFNGQAAVEIPPGGSAISDVVPVPVAANADLLLSIAVAGSPGQTTGHLRPKDNSYLSGPGDHGAREDGEAFPTVAPHWFFADALVGEDCLGAGAVAIIGDSITDSGGTPRGAYQGWVDLLGHRLARLPEPQRLGLVNAGISGNRVAAERPGSGPSALARLDRDVLSHAGVHTLIIFEGINDIYGTPITAGPLIQAHAQLALRARLAGLRVIGATLLPTRRQGFTAEREGVRAALNGFIRTSPLYDRRIDFEAGVRDPADPLALLPAYDSGDRLHPSPAGYRALAEAVPLGVLYP